MTARSAARRGARTIACPVAALLLLLPARVARGQAGLDSVVPPSPAPRGFVYDGGPVLDTAALARLNARIAAVQRATGGDIGVAIVRDLHGRAPVDVGVAIYRAWKIGHVDSIGAARRDLGALLLVVPRELAPDHRGQCWVATGRGAEGELTDARAGSICRDSVIPHLRRREYEQAVAAGVEGIAARLAATVSATTPATGSVPNATPNATPNAVPNATHRTVTNGRHGRGGLVALLAVLVALLGGTSAAGVAGVRSARRRRPRTCPRGHGPMVRLDEVADDAALSPGQRAEERLGSVDYDVWACPTCDERLVIPYTRWWSSIKGCPQCGFRTVRSETRTLRAATTASTGLEETRLTCANCDWRDVAVRETPRIQPSSGGSDGGGASAGGVSFGGSGSTAGGGGGASY